MKKIQITQDLFVKILKYFYSEEFELDDDELCELYHEIKRALIKSLTQFQEEATTPNIKQLILLKQKNTQGRSILMLWVCTEISDIDSLLTT